MTVRDLIDKLLLEDPDRIVLVDSGYGYDGINYVETTDEITERATDKKIKAVVLT